MSPCSIRESIFREDLFLYNWLQDESKERADIIRDTLTGIEGEIVSIKDLVQTEKAALEEAIQGRYSVMS